MIRETQIAWLREFLTKLCESPEDRHEVEDICASFQKLWHVAHAAKRNPYPQSPKLAEALAAIKDPPQPLVQP